MNSVFVLYKSYLIQKATQDGRPFKLPSDDSTLVTRNDYKLFLGLDKLLKDSKLTVHEYKLFMICARNHLQGSFYISSILDYFNVILKEYKEREVPTENVVIKEIQSGFKKLEEFVIINNIRSILDMSRGNPPSILKLWKEGTISDIVLVHLIDLSELKRKSWFPVYCATLYPNINKIKSIISYNSDIKECLVFESKKLADIMKAFVK